MQSQRPLTRHLLGLLVALPSILGIVAATPFALRAAHADPIDDYVEAQRLAHKAAGISIAVVRDGRVIKTAGYGLASVELGASASPATVYPIGAVGETFVAALVQMLAADGKFRLDDPVSRYLPAAPAKITIRRLIDHATGSADPTADYRLLVTLAEKIGGAPYAVQLRDRLLIPREMRATRPNDPAEIVPNRAAGYRHVGGVRRNAAPTIADSKTIPANPAAAINLLTTVGDLAKWGPATTAPNAADATGGWNARTAGGHPVLARGGAIGGFRAQFSCYPGDALTVIVLANDADFPAGLIADGIAGIYVPGISIAAEPTIPDDAPAITTRVQRIASDLARQTLSDPGWFTPEVWRLVQLRLDHSAEYRALGELQSIDLIESRDHAAQHIHAYRYRLNYPQNIMDVTLATDAAGKISALSMHVD